MSISISGMAPNCSWQHNDANFRAQSSVLWVLHWLRRQLWPTDQQRVRNGRLQIRAQSDPLHPHGDAKLWTCKVLQTKVGVIFIVKVLKCFCLTVYLSVICFFPCFILLTLEHINICLGKRENFAGYPYKIAFRYTLCFLNAEANSYFFFSGKPFSTHQRTTWT